MQTRVLQRRAVADIVEPCGGYDRVVFRSASHLDGPCGDPLDVTPPLRVGSGQALLSELPRVIRPHHPTLRGAPGTGHGLGSGSDRSTRPARDDVIAPRAGNREVDGLHLDGAPG